MIVIGGLGSVGGAACGAVFVALIPHLLTKYADDLPLLTAPGTTGSGVSPGDAARYLSHYSERFSAGGQDYAAWAAHKRGVNASKRWIKVGVSRVAMLAYPRQDFVVVTFIGAVAPARTAPDVVGKLNAAINATLRSEVAAAALAKLGAEVNPGSPQELAAFLASEREKCTDVVRRAEICELIDSSDEWIR